MILKKVNTNDMLYKQMPSLSNCHVPVAQIIHPF